MLKSFLHRQDVQHNCLYTDETALELCRVQSKQRAPFQILPVFAEFRAHPPPLQSGFEPFCRWPLKGARAARLQRRVAHMGYPYP